MHIVCHIICEYVNISQGSGSCACVFTSAIDINQCCIPDMYIYVHRATHGMDISLSLVPITAVFLSSTVTKMQK